MSGDYSIDKFNFDDLIDIQIILGGYAISPLEALIIYETQAIGTYYTDILSIEKKIPNSFGDIEIEKIVKDLAHPDREFLHLYHKKDVLCFNCTSLGRLVYRDIKKNGYNILLEHFDKYKEKFSIEKIPYKPEHIREGKIIKSKNGGTSISIYVERIGITNRKLEENINSIIYESNIEVTIRGCPKCDSWIHASYLIDLDNCYSVPFIIECKNCGTILHIYRHLWRYKIIS